MNIDTKNYFRVRAYPNHKDHFSDFKKNEFIAIGWPSIGDVKDNSKREISEKLIQNYPDLKKQSLGLTTGFFTRLLSMKEHDIILIPYENRLVVIAEVTKPYEYINNQKMIDQHMTHQVKIKILKELPIKKLTKELKRSIDTITTLISLNKYSKEIDHLINNNSLEVFKNKTLSYVSNNTEKFISVCISSNVHKEDFIKFIDEIF